MGRQTNWRKKFASDNLKKKFVSDQRFIKNWLFKNAWAPFYLSFCFPFLGVKHLYLGQSTKTSSKNSKWFQRNRLQFVILSRIGPEVDASQVRTPSDCVNGRTALLARAATNAERLKVMLFLCSVEAIWPRDWLVSVTQPGLSGLLWCLTRQPTCQPSNYLL